MNWEQVKDLSIGHVWDHRDLWKHFRLLAGGIAYPGKRPGFVVVAGLRPIYIERHYEIHVLDEVESPDLGELLRLCRGLIPKYHDPASPDELFRWFGDWQNTAAQTLIRDLNDVGSSPRMHDLDIQSTPILDMETPYAFMVARLREYTREGQKTLHLRGSRVTSSLTEIPQGELSELAFSSHPAVEALAFVVEGLRGQAEYIWYEMTHPHDDGETPVDWCPGQY